LPTKKNPSNLLDNIRLAFSFLTIIPISVKSSSKDNALAGSMGYFPFVGFCIGLLSLIIISVFEQAFSPRLINLLLVLLPILLSGGLHIDGLADSFDAFFQGKSKEDILRVLRDSRIGVWGALSIVFLVLIKWELLMILPNKAIVYLFALSASRWAHVVLSFLLPYAREENGLGKEVAGLVQKKELNFSTLFMIAMSFLLGLKGIVVLVICAGFIYLLSRFYKRKISGITGDVIGATGELTEIFVYIMIVIFYGSSVI